jgi:hypothetical protein
LPEPTFVIKQHFFPCLPKPTFITRLYFHQKIVEPMLIIRHHPIDSAFSFTFTTDYYLPIDLRFELTFITRLINLLSFLTLRLIAKMRQLQVNFEFVLAVVSNLKAIMVKVMVCN